MCGEEGREGKEGGGGRGERGKGNRLRGVLILFENYRVGFLERRVVRSCV